MFFLDSAIVKASWLLLSFLWDSYKSSVYSQYPVFVDFRTAQMTATKTFGSDKHLTLKFKSCNSIWSHSVFKNLEVVHSTIALKSWKFIRTCVGLAKSFFPEIYYVCFARRAPKPIFVPCARRKRRSFPPLRQNDAFPKSIEFSRLSQSL